MYKVERCRSHEVSSTPMAWETVFSGSEDEAVREYFARERVGRASGDQYRIVDESGVEQVILSESTCGPMY